MAHEKMQAMEFDHLCLAVRKIDNARKVLEKSLGYVPRISEHSIHPGLGETALFITAGFGTTHRRR